MLRVDLNVPATANCLLGFDFRFLSEEFPEYVGDSYSDAFVAELDRTTWTSSGSTITAPDNFAYDPNGQVVSINAAGATSMSTGEAAGTTFDGATPILSAATPLTPGAHSLYFTVFDQGDDKYDSAVLVDNLRIGHVDDVATQCVKGAKVADRPVSASTTFHDAYGTSDDTYTIPSTTGVSYEVGGVTKPAGTYPGLGTVTVTAVPDDGYAVDGRSTFSHTFATDKTTDQTSTGTGTATQTVTPDQPAGGSITLLDADGQPATTVSVPGEGTYTLDPATGVITFVPTASFHGTGTGVVYQITESGGATSQSTYVPTVQAPAGPSASATSTSGVGTAVQATGTLQAPGGDLQVQDADGTWGTTTTTADGTFAVSGDHLTFSPVAGHAGAHAVSYRVSDAYGQWSTAVTYTATVTAPAAPPAAPSPAPAPPDSRCRPARSPTATSSLLDADGDPVTTLTVPGQGTYTVTGGSGGQQARLHPRRVLQRPGEPRGLPGDRRLRPDHGRHVQPDRDRTRRAGRRHRDDVRHGAERAVDDPLRAVLRLGAAARRRRPRRHHRHPHRRGHLRARPRHRRRDVHPGGGLLRPPDGARSGRRRLRSPGRRLVRRDARRPRAAGPAGREHLGHRHRAAVQHPLGARRRHGHPAGRPRRPGDHGHHEGRHLRARPHHPRRHLRAGTRLQRHAGPAHLRGHRRVRHHADRHHHGARRQAVGPHRAADRQAPAPPVSRSSGRSPCPAAAASGCSTPRGTRSRPSRCAARAPTR
nr:choice-of-anchor L domain-containing protein [Angustibacter aerolatus]